MSSNWTRIKFVSGNPDKIREAREIIAGIIDPVDPGELVEIQTSDVLKLVTHKARQAYELVGGAVIVEDSGLFFKAWNGLPGALVKWFEISVGCEGMVKMLSSFDNRTATALSCIALHDGKDVKIAQGRVQGHITMRPMGDNGFGWDTIFIPEGYNRTFAQMNPEEKNAISHRRRAFEALKEMY